MYTGLFNPFESSVFINPRKLGLKKDDARVVKAKLQPFLEHYRQMKEKDAYKGKQVYFISPDGGAEMRVERFIAYAQAFVDDLPPEEVEWDYMGYRDKSRATIEGSAATFKHFSGVNLENIDPDGVYIILDDMLSSGGTAEKLASALKKEGAGCVELWCSHAVAPERDKVMKLEALDKIVVLDTILHDNPEELKLEYIEASADILAAELYKAHMRLEEARFTV